MNQNYIVLTESFGDSPSLSIHRQEQLASSSILRKGFLQYFHLDYSDVTLLRTPTGKPYLQDHEQCYFNLSHSHGLAAAVFAPFPVGIDIELPRSLHQKIWDKVCTPEERLELDESSDPSLTFCRIWTQKESYLKLTGDGLSIPLHTLKIPDCVRQDIQHLQSGHIMTISYYLDSIS